ncbi:hypothetical protein D3C76_1294180 [compost metagenome]
MRLSRTVIRVLAQNHHFHIIEFGIAKGVKHIFLRGIDRLTGLPFCGDSAERIHKIGLLFLFCQHVMPGLKGSHDALLHILMATSLTV